MESLQYYSSHDDYCFVCLNCSSEAPLRPRPGNIDEFFAGIVVNVLTPWMCCSCASVVQAYHESRERARRAQTLLSTVMLNPQLIQTNEVYFTAEFNYIKYNTQKPLIDQRPTKESHKPQQADGEGIQNVDANDATSIKDEINIEYHDPCAEIAAHTVVRTSSLSLEVDSMKLENASSSGVHISDQCPSGYSQPQIKRIQEGAVYYYEHKQLTPKSVNPAQPTVMVTNAKPKRSEIYRKDHPLRIRVTDTHVTFDENDDAYMRMNDLLHENILNNRITDEEYRQWAVKTRQSEEYIKSDKDKCEQCAIIITQKPAFIQHMKRHNEVTPHQCHLCTQYMHSPERLEVHISKHLYQYACLLCGHVERARSPLITHYFTQHTRINFHCKHCIEPVFKEPIALLKHIEVWHKYKECSICHKIVARKRLQQHEAEHKTSLLQEVFCKICDLRLRDRYSLSKHMKVVHSEKNKQEQCTICNKMIKKLYMEKHVQNHKAQSKPTDIDEEDNPKVFVCKICNKSVKSLRTLEKHHHRHATEKSEQKSKWECDDCNTIFAHKSYLRRHILRIHLKIFAFKCSQCPQAFIMDNDLRRHVRGSHSMLPLPKNKMCDICGKSFTGKKVLESHRLIHTGEKPHSCEQCGRAFRQECALQTHIKLVHLGIKYKDLLASRKKRKQARAAKAAG